MIVNTLFYDLFGYLYLKGRVLDRGRGKVRSCMALVQSPKCCSSWDGQDRQGPGAVLVPTWSIVSCPEHVGRNLGGRRRSQDWTWHSVTQAVAPQAGAWRAVPQSLTQYMGYSVWNETGRYVKMNFLCYKKQPLHKQVYSLEAGEMSWIIL